MIVVAGGTGTLGQRLIPRLVKRGLPVRVFTRDPARARDLAHGDYEVFVGDIRDHDRVTEAVQNTTAVISAIHGFTGTGRVTPESVDRNGNAHQLGDLNPSLDRGARGAEDVAPRAPEMPPDRHQGLIWKRSQAAVKRRLTLLAGLPY